MNLMGLLRCECKKKVRLVHYNLHIRSNCQDFFEMDQTEIQRIMLFSLYCEFL